MGKKSKKKAIKTIERATKRDEPELPHGYEWKNYTSRNIVGGDMLEEAILSRWQPQVDAMVELHASKDIAVTDNEDEYIKHKQEIIKMATDILTDIETFTKETKDSLALGEENKGSRFFIRPQMTAYELRSCCFINLKMFKECIEDCSLVLQSGYTTPGTCSQFTFLMKRGTALDGLGRLDEAIMDFRAAVASFRLVEKPWKDWPTLNDAKEALFFATCRQKIGSPRPQFTDEERDSLLKELGAGHYHKDKRKCLECGRLPTKDVPLSLCLGCHCVWFCNKTCQTKAWKSGHKKTCKEILCHALFGDIDEMKERLSSSNYFGFFHETDESVCIMKDPATGVLFNSLRDNEVAAFGRFTADTNGRLLLQLNANSLGIVNPAETRTIIHDASNGCPEVKKQIDAYTEQFNK